MADSDSKGHLPLRRRAEKEILKMSRPALDQAEAMRRLRRFWARNPRDSKQMVKIFDKYWLMLSRFNKEILAEEWSPGSRQLRRNKE